LTATKPDHPYNSEENLEFLRKIGGWGKDRTKGVEGLTLEGLLMFGKLEAIQEAMPYYFVDYREVLDERSATEWIDRITPDGTWSGNLYDFYRLTIQRLFNGLRVQFQLRGDERQDDTPLHKAMREALVNTIIHADYSAPVPTLVVKGPSYFGFRNPGKMRIPAEQALQGGTSDSRNRNIQKMFSLINLGEQAGSGIPRVVENWKSQHFRIPELWEKEQPESTWMRLRMVSLLPEETLEELSRLFGAKFEKLNENERLALATSHIESFVTNGRLQQVCDLHSHDITTLLKGLVKQGFLEQDGKARGTTYRLHGVEPIDLARSEDLGESSLDNDPSSIGNAIKKDLLEIAKPVRSKKRVRKEVIQQTIQELCQGRFLTIQQLGSYLDRVPEDLRNRFIKPMVESGKLIRRFPDRPNHEQQAYQTRQGDE